MHRSLKRYGEWDIRLKNSIFKSFRFEIVLYSLLSLIYTILTEAGLCFGYYVIRNLFRDIRNTSMNAQNTMSMDKAGSLNNAGASSFPLPPDPSRKEGMVLILALAVIAGILLFILYFLLLTKKFVIYLDEIAQGINEISIGNFEARVDIKNEDEFAWIAGRINKMAEDIQILMENERQNEKARNDLITNVAHDLRTPLTSIIGYLDLVKLHREMDEETKGKYICVAYDKSKRLEKLIEDLFSYTKYSSGEVTLNPQEIDMVKFMKQMVEEFYPSFQEAGLDYTFEAGMESAFIRADGDLLARAVTNLISNAVKYGKDGKSIRMYLEKKENNLRIAIINYGEVIPEKDLGNIFDRFYRVENSRSRETGGTGLGLAIAKRIILMHHGSISVKSDFDGTVFEVLLPLNEESEVTGINETKNA